MKLPSPQGIYFRFVCLVAGLVAMTGVAGEASSHPSNSRRPSASELQQRRRLVHRVAIREGLDPCVLVAIAMKESQMQPLRGRAGEYGHFQVMPAWARRFGLSTPRWFMNLEVGATAAARIYLKFFRSWRSSYSRAGTHRCLRRAGWKSKNLTREAWAAMGYNMGSIPSRFRRARSPLDVKIPSSVCRYAVRFQKELRKARRRGCASGGRRAVQVEYKGPGNRRNESPSPARRLVVPLQAPHRVVGRYGEIRWRRDRRGHRNGTKRHHGIDLEPKAAGDAAFVPVQAVAAGRVVRVFSPIQFHKGGGRLLQGRGKVVRAGAVYPRSLVIRGYGRVHPFSARYGIGRTGVWIVIAHPKRGPMHGNWSHYMHLSAVRVREGQWVLAGEEIGRVGGTAILSSRPHLHFAVSRPRRLRRSYHYVDPRPFFQGKSQRLSGHQGKVMADTSSRKLERTSASEMERVLQRLNPLILQR